MELKTTDNLKSNLSEVNFQTEIEIALRECDELDDDAQKVIFKTILKTLQFMISQGHSFSTRVDDFSTGVKDVGLNIDDNPEYIRNLCKPTKINANDLEYIFNFKDDNLELATITGKNWEEKQINASLCILTANFYCFGNGEITSSNLAEQLKKMKMGSMGNLSTNLRKYTHFIEIDEVYKTQKVYKIKGPGKTEGLRIIQEQISQQKGELNE